MKSHRRSKSILNYLFFAIVLGNVQIACGGNAKPTKMEPYTETIPGTNVTFEMIPVPGGDFSMGSPEAETDRQADEGPQVRVRIEPFWMGRCEVTWAEYRSFMDLYYAFKSIETLRMELAQEGKLAGQAAKLKALSSYLKRESLEVDGVTCPTPLYDPDTTYMAGEEPEQPAVTMTQFAAKQYTKWLSGITGKEYRLPTEAEWEYAARAGTTTPYSFGDGASIDDYAWHADNSDDLTQPVGTKKPNPWGLHDMHGNVAEWVLDAYGEDHYEKVSQGDSIPDQAFNKKIVSFVDVINWPKRIYPRSIRGGAYFDEASMCRSAARHKSADPDWSVSDPSLPKSPWWFTEYETTGVGFRIIRPFAPMSEKEKKKVWDTDTKRLKQNVEDRLDEGRGTRSAVDSRLPEAIIELQDAGLVE